MLGFVFRHETITVRNLRTPSFRQSRKLIRVLIRAGVLNNGELFPGGLEQRTIGVLFKTETKIKCECSRDNQFPLE